MSQNISIAGSEDWLIKLNKTIAKLGQAEFEDSLFDLVNAVVCVDHCAVFINDNQGAIAHLFTKSKLSDDICQSLAKAYTERFYVRDPKLEPLEQGLEGAMEPRMTLLPHTPNSAYDKGYQARFFTDTGLVDKVSSLLQTRQFNIYCSFYRLTESGRFEAHEFDQLSQILPILTNLIFKHSRLSGLKEKENQPDPIITQVPLSRTSDASTNLLKAKDEVFAQLTTREQQVCIRILQGFTSEAISLDLKVAMSTIHTYRKRAYSKLGISSQNELFSLYLEFISLLT